MRIFHVFSALRQGGAENQLELMLDCSSRLNPEIEHIVISLVNETTPLTQRLVTGGFKVVFFNFKCFTFLIEIIKLRKFFKQHMCSDDLIQSWMYHANLLTSISILGINLNVVWNIRRTEIPRGATGIVSRLSAVFSNIFKTKIVFNSFSGLESHKNAHYYVGKSHVIHNGFSIPYEIELFDIENEYLESISDADTVFGMVGRYAPVKGHLDILRSIVLLSDFCSPDIFEKLRFVFVGRGIKNEPSLFHLIHNPRIRNNLIFIEEKPNIFPYLKTFDFFVLPSRSEGFPNCLVEAMLSSLPCIATDVGDVKLITGGHAFMAKPGDPKSLCDVLLSSLSKSEDEKGILAQKLKMLASEYYTIEACWSKYLTLYKSILD